MAKFTLLTIKQSKLCHYTRGTLLIAKLLQLRERIMKKILYLVLVSGLILCDRCSLTFAAEEMVRIEKIRWESFSEGVRIYMVMDSPMPVLCYETNSPPAIVIDPIGKIYTRETEPILVNQDMVRKIRMVASEEKSEGEGLISVDFLVVELEKPLVYHFSRDKNTEIIDILRVTKTELRAEKEEKAEKEAKKKAKEEEGLRKKAEREAREKAKREEVLRKKSEREARKKARREEELRKRVEKETLKRARGHRNKGLECQRAGNLDKALEYYGKAIETYPQFACPHNDLAIIYLTQGKLKEAEKELIEALRINPKYLQAHSNLAYLYEKLKEDEKAIKHWSLRYQLGDPQGPWTQKAKERVKELGGAVE